jgi:Glycosyl hydrolase family 26
VKPALVRSPGVVGDHDERDGRPRTIERRLAEPANEDTARRAVPVTSPPLPGPRRGATPEPLSSRLLRRLLHPSPKPSLPGMILLILLTALALFADSATPVRARAYSTLRAPLSVLPSAHRIVSEGSRAPLERVRRPRLFAQVAGVDTKADCAYGANNVAVLDLFELMVGRVFDCALVFNNLMPDWAKWANPWFLTQGAPYNWADWVHAPGPHRQLIISQNLFPLSLNGSDWRDAGAAGAYVEYARQLAENLVAAGLGDSVIRLAHEANDASSPYWIGSTPHDWQLWREFWRRTVIAMRSVPGAHFLFDWCILEGGQPVPLRDWYPGDDVVNIIGIDVYDGGVPVGVNRWQWLYTQPDGIRDVLRFANAHQKPVSFPEWGLEPADAQNLGGGDDPTYVNRLARVIRNNPVAYQSYFFNHQPALMLAGSPLSLTAYRRHFGAGGDSVGAPTITP